jgi:SAM-dependent methyltransferase
VGSDPATSQGAIVVPGFCPVCGQWAIFAGAPPFRESLICRACLATSRYRRMALGVLRAIRELSGVDAASLEQLPSEGPVSIRILDTQTPFSYPPYAAYTIPDRLAQRDWLDVHTSSFRPNQPWGAALGEKSTNQTLERLTFEDDSFDVLLTSDVMEHVRLPDRAHAEIARVLRRGGVYLFTVPHSRGLADNLTRVRVHDPSDAASDEHILPDEFHGSTGVGEGPVLSYRVFGLNIDRELDDLGFDVEYTVEPSRLHAVFQTELFYCRRR